MKKIIKYLVISGIIAFFAMGFYFKIYIPKHKFKIIQPVKGNLQVRVKGIGNVDALKIYSITAQSGGKILEILTDKGKWVKKGELLIVMDGVDLPDQLEMAKASLVQFKYNVKALQSEFESQKAKKELLKLTYNRYYKLKTRGFINQSEYDKSRIDLQSIDASLDATLARINSAKSALVVASKNINALNEKIARLKIYSPVDGYVIERGAEQSRNVLATTPVLKIVDPETLWVEANIDERISAQIKPLQKAVITLRSQPDKVYKGIVKRVDPITDAITLERRINIGFKTIPEPFYINEQAMVLINVKQYKNVLKIPLNIVVYKNGKTGIWVLKNKHAHFFVLDELSRNDIEMAISNIDRNIRIIVPDMHKKPLSEGMVIYQ